jgi:GT2 family glycosyltransferase
LLNIFLWCQYETSIYFTYYSCIQSTQGAVCLEAVACLKYPRECLEVILVDDGSRISIDPVVRHFQHRINMIVLKQKNAGPASARNTGARHAKGEFLVFTDHDCAPDSNWLNILSKHFIDTPDCLFGGRTINRLTDNIFSTTSQIIIDMVYNHYNSNPQQAHFFTTNNIGLSAKQFNRLGGLNPILRAAEDREFCDRWRYNGYRMIYVKDAIIYHYHRLNLSTFCKQHFDYGRYAYHYHKIRDQRKSGNFRGEMTFHMNVQNLLFFPFSQVHWKKRMPLAGNLLLWQIVNFLGFFYEAIEGKRKNT